MRADPKIAEVELGPVLHCLGVPVDEHVVEGDVPMSYAICLQELKSVEDLKDQLLGRIGAGEPWWVLDLL